MDELNRSFEILKLMKRVSNTIKQEIHKQFGEMNLTAPQGMMIGVLMHHGPQKVTDLSERMSLSNSTVSGIIDRLEKNGSVMRVRSEEDRRVVMIDLTPEMKASASDKFKAIDDLMAKMIAFADDTEVEEIFKGFTTLDRVISRYKGVGDKK